jgi:hypothetical protein
MLNLIVSTYLLRESDELFKMLCVIVTSGAMAVKSMGFDEVTVRAFAICNVYHMQISRP